MDIEGCPEIWKAGILRVRTDCEQVDSSLPGVIDAARSDAGVRLWVSAAVALMS
jgi:hypothetical protein